MKKSKLFILIGTAVAGLGQLAVAGPHGGGGGFGGGGHFGGYSGALRGAPGLASGARFSNRGIGGLSRGSQQFSYYGGARVSTVTPRGFTGSVNRPVTSYSARQTAISRQPNRVDSMATRNRVSDPRISRATNRGSFNTNRAFARHDANWHRDWDKRRAHFDHRHVFVFINGFWYGFYPWDYLPYDTSYPYDYYGYPYGYYDYDNQSVNADSGQYESNATVAAAQSQLAGIGYYRGAIDGVEGDETQAALARYQQDHDLSVTGTLTADTLRALGSQ